MIESANELAHQDTAQRQNAIFAKAVKAYIETYTPKFPESCLPEVACRQDAENGDRWHFTLSANKTQGNYILAQTKNILKHIFSGDAEIGVIEQEPGSERVHITFSGVPAQMNADIFGRDRDNYPQPSHTLEVCKRTYCENNTLSR